MADFSGERIGGALILPHDPRNIKLDQVVTALPPVPSGVVRAGKRIVSWGMHRNSDLGDCVFAAQANQIEAASSDATVEQVVPDEDVIAAYSRVTGYIPGNGATDGGSDPTAAANDWRTNGLGGRKIYGWAQVPAGNVALQRFALYYCDGLQITLNLPNTAKTQAVWDVVSGADPDSSPGSWGGHEVFGCNHDPATGLWKVATWNYEQPMTQRFLDTYGWLLIAAIPVAWFDGSGEAPVGFSTSQFQRYLTIASGGADPGPPPFVSDPTVVAWLRWQSGAVGWVESQYAAGNVTGAQQEEAVVLQYTPQAAAVLSGAKVAAVPPEVPA